MEIERHGNWSLNRSRLLIKRLDLINDLILGSLNVVEISMIHVDGPGSSNIERDRIPFADYLNERFAKRMSDGQFVEHIRIPLREVRNNKGVRDYVLDYLTRYEPRLIDLVGADRLVPAERRRRSNYMFEYLIGTLPCVRVRIANRSNYKTNLLSGQIVDLDGK